MTLTDQQRALLAERLTELMMRDMDVKTLERMVYDIYLDEYILMSDSDLLMEAEMFEVEVPGVIIT
jgi:hypothetical protein